MPEWTFQARAYKVLKKKVDAATFDEAEALAEEAIKQHVEDNDYRDWDRDSYYLPSHPGDYPERRSWPGKRKG